MGSSCTRLLVVLFGLLAINAAPAFSQWDENATILLGPGSYPQIVQLANSHFVIIRYTRDGTYGQQIDINGYSYWGENGIGMGGYIGWTQKILCSKGNSSFLAWTGINLETLAVRKFDSTGAWIWVRELFHSTRTNYYAARPKIVPADSADVIVTWMTNDGMGNSVWIQKLDSSGIERWGIGGKKIDDAEGSYVWLSANPNIVADGHDGAIVAWIHFLIDGAELRVQHVGSNGNLLWGANGISLGYCTSASGVHEPQIVSDGSGGAIVSWAYNDTLYAQRIEANGNPSWPQSHRVVGGGFTASLFDMVSGESGHAIISWDGNGCVLANMLDLQGNKLWGEDGLCLSTGGGYSRLTYDNDSNTAIVLWTVNFSDLRAQKIDQYGSILWPDGGLWVASSSGRYHQICSDNEGGAIVVWAGTYAKRILSNGEFPVATLLQNYSAAFTGKDIEVKWTLAELEGTSEFILSRAQHQKDHYIELQSAKILSDGLSYSFADKEWEPGTTYWYKVDYIAGDERRTLLETDPITTPAMPLSVLQNHPNPFNPSTTIEYYLPKGGPTSLDIYDISGKWIANLAEGELEKGQYIAEWNGKDMQGNPVASGIYFYRLKAGKQTVSRKLVLLR